MKKNLRLWIDYTIETLGRKYDSFNADSEFKDRFKEVFYNFVKLINNFTYLCKSRNSRNRKWIYFIPDLHNKLVWFVLFKRIDNSKVVKEYNPKLAYTALTPGSIIYFSGLKYMRQIWDEEIKNDLPNLKKF